MAAGGDDEQKEEKDTLSGPAEKTEAPNWSETCIGVWTRNVSNMDANSSEVDFVCTGINVIKVNDLDPATIKPSHTRGVQIMLTSHEKSEMDSTSSRGQAASASSVTAKPQDQFSESFSLSEHFYNLYKQKKEKTEDRLFRYRQDPTEAKEIFYEAKEAGERYYETGKRIFTYLKPLEKLKQMQSFAGDHMKELGSWIDSYRK